MPPDDSCHQSDVDLLRLSYAHIVNRSQFRQPLVGFRDRVSAEIAMDFY